MNAYVESMLRSMNDTELLALANPERDGDFLYSPHYPSPKQKTFLDLDCFEALFGGAAGPGKTDALLMAALKYVHVPNYSAIILRVDFKRLSLAEAIMDRSKKWLSNTNAKWNGSEYNWKFPNGATLQFGYLQNPGDRYRYQSAEFQFVAFEELTEFRLSKGEENPYLFMMSRCRKKKCEVHAKKNIFDPLCPHCRIAGELQNVPLRVRSATNPGGNGHHFVLDRFFNEESLMSLRNGETGKVYYNGWSNECRTCEFKWPTHRDVIPDKCQCGSSDIKRTKDRAFVPAVVADNPVLDKNEYIGTLMHLPEVTRLRLIHGDWSVVEDSIIDSGKIRDFDVRGENLVGIFDGKTIDGGVVNRNNCVRFATCDTAGTEEDIIKKHKGRDPSWSALGVWDYWRERNWLFLRYIWRRRVGWNELKDETAGVLKDWSVPTTLIENKHWGNPLSKELRSSGAGGQIQLVEAKEGKLARATKLLTMIDNCEIFLPVGNTSWRPTLEAEWFSWTGHPDEHDDQIDIASMAANHVKKTSGAWGGQVDEAIPPASRFRTQRFVP